MSTLALRPEEVAALPAQRSSRPSLLRRLIAARERQAMHIITSHLASQTDERLSHLGLTANEIAALRRQTLQWSIQ